MNVIFHLLGFSTQTHQLVDFTVALGIEYMATYVVSYSVVCWNTTLCSKVQSLILEIKKYPHFYTNVSNLILSPKDSAYFAKLSIS